MARVQLDSPERGVSGLRLESVPKAGGFVGGPSFKQMQITTNSRNLYLSLFYLFLLNT